MFNGGSGGVGHEGPPSPQVEGFSELVEVGRGGNSVVYRAWENHFQRQVALKVLHQTDPAFLRRFEREAAAVGRLSDLDGVLTVYSRGTTTAGQPFIAMPLLAAGSLADRLDTTGPLAWSEMAPLMASVAHTMATVHDRGIVHGDLKPHNIMIDDAGRPQIVDFGVARLAGGDTATSIGFTAAYAAPELLRDGASPGTPADVYGLGATATALLLGHGPFSRDSGDAPAVVVRVLTEAPELPQNCPSPLRDLLAWSLSREAADRPTMTQLASGLERTVGPDEAPTTVRPLPSPAVTTPRIPEAPRAPVDHVPVDPTTAKTRERRSLTGLFLAVAAVFLAAALAGGYLLTLADDGDGNGGALLISDTQDDTDTDAENEGEEAGRTEPLSPPTSQTTTTSTPSDTEPEPQPEPLLTASLGGGVAPLFPGRDRLPLPNSGGAGAGNPLGGGAGIRDVALGGDHSCAIDWTDRLWCWGDGTHGELGLGDFDDRDRPSPVGTTPMFQVALGGDHTCGLDFDGRGYCWGANDDGQLGDGSQVARSTPTPVAGDLTFVRIGAGGNYSCGLEETGSVWCWGANDDGQLGDGSITPSAVPVPVAGDHHFVLISTGGRFACAVDIGREVWCWGDNEYGQLGNGELGQDSVEPVKVTPLDGADHLSSGDWFACVLERSRSVRCWGRNDRGEIGDGSVDHQPTPRSVTGSRDGTMIAADGFRACYLDLLGEMACWGANGHGELGIGDTEDRADLTSVEVPGANPLFVATGNWHSCVIDDVGDLYCWGRNIDGGLGLGDLDNRMTPALVSFD